MTFVRLVMRRALPAVALAALPAPVPAAAADRIYGGQPTPAAAASRMLVSVALDADSTRLQRLTYRVDMGCDPAVGLDAHMSYGTPQVVEAFPARRRDGRTYLLDGRVEAGRIAWNLRRVEDVGGGVTATTTASFAGTVSDVSARGTATFLVRLRRGSDEVDACSASVPWRANRAPGMIFAGETAQHEPVVIEVSADRTRLRHAHIGWHATCSSGAMFGAPHEELGWRSAPLSADGPFVFSHQASAIGALVRTRLAGRIAPANARGTFSGSARFRLPDGDRCRTHTVRWSAATG